MKNLIIIGIIAIAAYYYIQSNTTCTTQQDVMDKAAEMERIVRSKGRNLSVSKAEAIINKVKDFKVLSAANEFQATCDIMQEIMDEL